MHLEGESLSLGMRGGLMARLHRELRQLGLTVEIPQSEIERKKFGEGTRAAVIEFQSRAGFTASGVVDEETARAINEAFDARQMPAYIARGRVLRADHTPFVSVRVRAFDKDFRSEQSLGETQTDAHGRFEIRYKHEQFRRAEKKHADLQVRAYAPGVEEPLAESEVLYNAPMEAFVELSVDGQGASATSEYERHLALIKSLIGHVRIEDFTKEDIDFLSGETRIVPGLIAFLAVAHRHQLATRVPAAAYYGLFRQGLPTRLAALLMVPNNRHRQALDRSLRAQIIPAELANAVDDILDRLERAQTDQLLAGDDENRTVVSALMEGVPRPAQEKFLNRYLRHEGPLEAFWNSLGEDEDLTAEQIEQFRLNLQIGLVTGNNVPLLSLLKTRVHNLDDLVDLETDDLTTLIRAAGNGELAVPEHIAGDTDEERINAYAISMREDLRDALPTAFVRQGIAKDPRWPENARADLFRFFSNAPEFDFREAPVDDFIARREAALEGVTDKAALQIELNRLQRVFRISPRWEHMQVLLDSGLDSAAAVVGVPRKVFLQDFSQALGGPSLAGMYYAKAQQMHAMAASVFTSIYQALHDVSPAVLGKLKPSSLGMVANWENLFGAVDFCKCRHCRSVYGPAAYLVDLLQFLRKSGKPFMKLTDRRPDLEHIKLTCENTNTPLPTVDLVNEILEFYVVHGAFADMAPAEKAQKAKELAHDTGDAAAEELSVNPQYVSEDADAALQQNVFSFMLPFNQPLETVRAYLQHQGTSRHQLMQLFQNEDPQNKTPTDLELALEYLTISHQEMTILTGQAPNTAREYFGYPAQNVSHKLPDGSTIIESWRANLARAPEFLRRTGVDYADVVALLKTRYFNPVKTEPLPPGTIVLYSPEKVCDLSRTWIQYLNSDHEHLDTTGLNETLWIKIHRFLRLRHKLGWTIPELDRALFSLNITSIDSDAIKALACLQQLNRTLERPIDQLLTCWSVIDTWGPDSLYERLFQNKSVTRPVDAAFTLTPSQTQLLGSSETINDHTATIQAALRLKAGDLALLREATGLAGATETLTIAKVSALYRHALLAKSLGLKIRDSLALQVMAGMDPFSEPLATLNFVERVQSVRDSAFQVAELDYLFRHILVPGKGPAPIEQNILNFLNTLRDGLNLIIAETEPVPDTTGELLRSKLATVMEPPVVDEAMAIVECVSSLSTPDQEQFVNDHFSAFLDPDQAKTELLGPSNLDPDQKKQANRDYVWPLLLQHLRETESRSLVKQSLSTSLPMEGGLLQPLIEEILPARSDPSRTAIADFLALPQASLLENCVPDYIRLHKIALLFNRFTALPDDLRYLAESGADFGGFDLSGMPLDRTNPAVVDSKSAMLFEQWERLRTFFKLRDLLPERDLKLLDVIGALSAGEARTKLSELAGWDPAETELVSGPQGMGLPDASFRNADAPIRLWEAFQLSRRLGVAVNQLNDWAKSAPSAEQAQQVVRAVKARYDDKQWLQSAKTVNDGLREKRKQALIATVLTDNHIVGEGIRDVNGLLEYFLIDTALDPCMMTSRIKQATLSVQLFVQRCLLNQETDVPPSSIDAERWRWMRNYRVWEANRKVFLYPENWIEPELRDDKSPFFRELETQLLQNELTDENVELALMSYLEKVDDVGLLEAVGIYREKEGRGAGKVDQVHVVARTFNTPHLYYYRRYDALKNRWTAWEKITADIEGDHLIPLVWNRRLYLFWPIFVEKPDKAASTAYLPDGADPLTRREIRLAWSERRQTGWAAKQVSPDIVHSPVLVHEKTESNTFTVIQRWFYLPKPQDHYFRAFVKNGELWIDCARRYEDALDFKFEWVWENGNVYIYTTSWFGFSGHEQVGTFHFTGCRGRSDIDDSDTTLAFDAPREPKDTMTAAMGFGAKSKAKTLTFTDDYETQVLQKIDGPFHFLASPIVHDLGKTFYPFLYRDAKRLYFAIPTLDDPRRTWDIFRHPAIQIQMDRVDSFSSAFPVMDVAGSAVIHFARDKGPVLEHFDARGAPSRVGLPMSLPLGPGGRLISLGADQLPPALGTGFSINPTMMMKKSGSMGGMSKAALSAAKDTGSALYKAKKMARYLKFHIFFHPHVCALIKALNRHGIRGLLSLNNQKWTNDPPHSTVFDQIYDPAAKVHDDYPREDIDFRPEGAYSIYNWELFFHVPLFIASRLTSDQRFEEAQRWLHFIFDPTDGASGSDPARFWKVLPFFENDENGRIEEYLQVLHTGKYSEKQKIIQQIDEWRDNPFNPHLIARVRLLAYQKKVVITYIDNLIQWADRLFARDTLESINEATQIYILAYHILGRRPEQIPTRTKPAVQTFAQLKSKLDAFSNAMVELENAFPFTDEETISSSGQTGTETLGMSTAFYFCIPPNDELLKYWDIVEDRLFKIRHCMSIEGIERQLPLFEPPIDPALLVKAVAAGVDLGSVLSAAQAPLPQYRFQFMLQKSQELCAEVRSLGAALLAALEKKDAENLSTIRANHETGVLTLVRAVKKQQIDEAEEALEALRRSRSVAEERHKYYSSRPFMISAERDQIGSIVAATVLKALGEAAGLAAAAVEPIPDQDAGGAGSMGTPLSLTHLGGGSKTSGALKATAAAFATAADIADAVGRVNGLMAGYRRRDDDWGLQDRLANKEMAQIDKQIAAAEIRQSMAETELANHDQQIENAKAVEEFLRVKYTNQDLYNWMIGQISAVYFQMYKLAYDAAKRTERAFRSETALADTNYVQFGYWDSLRKGLLAGEKLQLDLKRLEMAYLEANKRKYELTKNLSLAQLDPEALLSLKQTGACEVEIPEWVFDADYPGHYLRMIQAVSLTLPCIVGPYTGVHCTLTLLGSSFRRDPTALPLYGDQVEDPGLVTKYGAVASIATSSGQNDAGLFELNFRDERYLPFEGEGAISRWRLELPPDSNGFDLETVSDVVLNLRYTAREGGRLLQSAAQKAIGKIIADAQAAPLVRLFSARHELTNEWHRFLYPANAASDQKMEFVLANERFPLLFQNKKLTIRTIGLFVKVKPEFKDSQNETALQLVLEPAGGDAGTPLALAKWNALLHGVIENVDWEIPAKTENGQWKLTAWIDEGGDQHGQLDPDAFDDIYLVCYYTSS